VRSARSVPETADIPDRLFGTVGRLCVLRVSPISA